MRKLQPGSSQSSGAWELDFMITSSRWFTAPVLVTPISDYLQVALMFPLDVAPKVADTICGIAS